MISDYPIGEVKIKPQGHSRLLLGSFKKDRSPKGFSVQVSPANEIDSVTSSVISLKNKNGLYNLVMNIDNYGPKTVKARIWPI